MNTMIKKITTTELDDLVGLFDQYMVFYKQPSAPEKYRKYLAERITNNDATVFVAYSADNAPMGFVLNYHSFSSVSQGKVIVLNDLFVADEFRQKGLGKDLINSSITLAKELGAVRVDLATAKDNYFAQLLYEKIGFVKDIGYFSYSLALAPVITWS
jgi:ribosomal protein S18 acetylase RimI-like enzyme